jgi:hypothetical protein
MRQRTLGFEHGRTDTQSKFLVAWRNVIDAMPYTVTADTVGLAIGSVSETANDVNEALNKARQMYEDGWQTFQSKTKRDTKLTGTSC